MTYGLGFAGVGWLGESLIKELPKFPDLGLAAVQDANAELVADVAARYGSAWQGSSFEDLLVAPGVDAVVISTPNALHVPQASAALRAGKHVLVQKPLATRAADAQALLDFARQSGRLLCVDYTYRFLDTVRAFEHAVAELGQLRRVDAVFHNIYGPGKAWFFDPALSGGGALVDLGVHLLDLALAVVAPRTVTLRRADLSFSAGHAVENAAALDVALDDVPCRVEVSWNDPRALTEIAVRVEGERGTAVWENVDGSFFRFRTLRNGACLLDRETTLREDTLRAFRDTLATGTAAPIDTRVYEVLDQAYAGSRAS